MTLDIQSALTSFSLFAYILWGITTPKIKKWSTQKWIDCFFRSHLVLVGYTASFAFYIIAHISLFATSHHFSSSHLISTSLNISFFLIVQFSVFRIISRSLKKFLIVLEQSLILGSITLSNAYEDLFNT